MENIKNTREFNDCLMSKNGAVQMCFSDNSNVILTETPPSADFVGQIEELANFSGRSVHLC
ncbi:MAG: hypothetical protein LBM09_00145 [Candidatus Nomurabacteria bacterium]|jgi:hypothetical protein|nr:hypothetical protein [Candidatus Nomurabacteria bacterium]